jgi:anaerobic ribonucleoside-triphosphate reductase
MQSATRRVKTIYSVIASSNRLEILRILNAKGPLSYSELKTLAGFKSKKESGKFAYHLRKLVRQMLVFLNRSERKYTVTNLGRLVLNLTRQIEEQAVIESGKLYVRTSHHSMEEFNIDKITQSLVREAMMPVELAQKITSEVEARLHKFQTTYLTAPLIREMVNALLIEHGYEEYRHRLTRLGLPIYDVNELLTRVGGSVESIESVIAQTAQSVFSEYLLLSQLSRDIADAHLNGDIHLSNAGSWGLMPDTLFVNLNSLDDSGINIGGKLPIIPRIGKPTNLDEAITVFMTLTSLLSREASTEITFEGLAQLLSRFSRGRTTDELKEAFIRTFTLTPTVLTQDCRRPAVSIQVGGELEIGEGVDESSVRMVEEAIVKAYSEYVLYTPLPKIKLVYNLVPNESDAEIVKSIASIIQNGGFVAVSTKKKDVHSFAGLKKNVQPSIFRTEGLPVLHSLSLNLPRLSRESNKDDTYFRAKLTLLIQSSLNALTTRKRIIHEMMEKGLLPVLACNPGLVSTESASLVVNLIGLSEASSILLGDRAAPTDRRTIVEKVVETAVKATSDKAGKLGEPAGVSIIRDEAALRFASLDAERYGRSSVYTEESHSYSQTPVIKAQDLSDEVKVREINWFHQKLNGGYSVNVDIPNIPTDEVSNILSNLLNRFEFFKLNRGVAVCKDCGTKSMIPSSRCKVCKSMSVVSYPML